LSSAILYLAIVAIWAFLLVPRWVRRSHAAAVPGTADTPVGDDADHQSGQELADAETGDLDDGRADDSNVSRPGILRTVGLLTAYGSPGGQLPDDQPEPDTAPIPAVTAPVAGSAAAAAYDARPAAEAPDQALEQACGPVSEPAPDEPVPGERRTRGLAGPPISRSKILQARRRLLTTLMLLAVAALSCTALGLTSGWVCVPPAVMLGMYLLLLREAALADAENARWRAGQANAARQRARARSREAWAARTPQPTAEIIDISARLGDQLYDQYADATVRAVGD
jgi:hypothetical protein